MLTAGLEHRHGQLGKRMGFKSAISHNLVILTIHYDIVIDRWKSGCLCFVKGHPHVSLMGPYGFPCFLRFTFMSSHIEQEGIISLSLTASFIYNIWNNCNFQGKCVTTGVWRRRLQRNARVRSVVFLRWRGIEEPIPTLLGWCTAAHWKHVGKEQYFGNVYSLVFFNQCFLISILSGMQ